MCVQGRIGTLQGKNNLWRTKGMKNQRDSQMYGCNCVMEIKKGETAPLALLSVTEGLWGLMGKNR